MPSSTKSAVFFNIVQKAFEEVTPNGASSFEDISELLCSCSCVVILNVYLLFGLDFFWSELLSLFFVTEEKRNLGV